MKIALIGYGKMGKMIEKCALEAGYEIVARIGKENWDEKTIAKADVCFEFSTPESSIANAQRLAQLKKPIVIGTTGWYEQKDLLEHIVEKEKIGAIYSPNFSIGIQLFLKIVAYSAQLMGRFEEYDISGIEQHHKHKLDVPSGTAKLIGSLIRSYTNKEVNFSSIRCGAIPGTHTVLFDSGCDTITLQHEARNREGFAKGALFAAKWLIGKEGLYTLEECINEMLEESLCN